MQIQKLVKMKIKKEKIFYRILFKRAGVHKLILEVSFDFQYILYKVIFI
jgi:hypothetical protein